jgi:uncharacterized membrane protein YqjE
MNPASTSETLPTGGIPGMSHGSGTPLPSNWQEALLSLIVSRVALIQLESKDAINDGVRRATCIVAAVICAFFAWALLLAGGIAAISNFTGWPWYWLAIAAAAAHLLASIGFARTMKAPCHPSFPVTRSEFQKDREWLENIQKTRKSNV